MTCKAFHVVTLGYTCQQDIPLCTHVHVHAFKRSPQMMNTASHGQHAAVGKLAGDVTAHVLLHFSAGSQDKTCEPRTHSKIGFAKETLSLKEEWSNRAGRVAVA